MKHMGLLLLLLVVIQACKPKEFGPQQVPGTNPEAIKGRKVYLVNEGNFGRGGSSISAYVPEREEHHNSVFSGANNGKLIGDIAQDMEGFGRYFYTVVNASGYVAVLDTSNLRLQDSIRGPFSAPRYLAAYQNKAYITDLYASKLWVADLTTNKVTGSLSLPGTGSHVLAWNNYILVAVSNQLILVDPATDQIDTVIQVHSSLDRMREAPDSSLWVLCKGSAFEAGELRRIEQDLSTDFSWRFGAERPEFLSMNMQTGDAFMLMSDGVYTITNYNGTSFQLLKVVELSDENIYALDVDPVTGDIYFADALDFDQASQIYRYDSTGVFLDQFQGGIITTDFHFTNKL